MKRKIAIVLAAALTVSALPVQALAATYKDINDMPWAGAKAYVENALSLRLLGGYTEPDGTLTVRAKNSVSYCEAVQMVYNLLVSTGMTTGTGSQADMFESLLSSSYKNIPSWSYKALSYCLEKGIITISDLSKFMDGSKQNPATREDVAVYLGKALSAYYPVNSSATLVYNDRYQIASSSVPYIDLLYRYKIMSGDQNQNFNPKKSINRAEIAVLMTQSYELLSQGVELEGTITSLVTAGTNSKVMTVKTAAGETMNFYLYKNTPIYKGDSSTKLEFDDLKATDKIAFTYSGSYLTKVRLISSTSQDTETTSDYDITGYVESLSSSKIRITNSETGAEEEFKVSAGTDYYLDGDEIDRDELKDVMSDSFLFVGIELDRDDEEKAVEVYAEERDEKEVIGELTNLTSSKVTYILQNSDDEKASYSLSDDCKYYLEGKSSTRSKVSDALDDGTTYVRLSINLDDEIVKLEASEDSYGKDAKKEADDYVEGTLRSISESRILIYDEDDDRQQYDFDDNPWRKISFYEDGKLLKKSSLESYVNSIENYLDDAIDDDDDVYVKIGFNDDEEIIQFMYSTKKSNLKVTETSTATKSGTVESIEDDEITLDSSSKSYALSRYVTSGRDEPDDAEEDYTYGINIFDYSDDYTQSYTYLKKICNDKDVEVEAKLYIVDDEVVGLDVEIVSVTGDFISYDTEDREIVVETNDYEYTFPTYVSLDVDYDDDDDYDKEWLDTQGKRAFEVELTFNGSGNVKKVVVND